MGFEGILLVVIGAWMAMLFAVISYVSFQTEHQSLHRYLEEEIHPLVEQSGRTGDWLKTLHDWFDRLAPTGEKIQLTQRAGGTGGYLGQGGTSLRVDG